MKRPDFFANKWWHRSVVILLCGLFGIAATQLTISSYAARATFGTLDVVTYLDSVKDGNEIGGVLVETDDGGSGVQCTPKSGSTDGAAGSNKGHRHFTCQAAANGGPRTFKFRDATRDGYSLSPNTPHPKNDAFHVSSGKTTTFSIVMTKDPTPASAPDPTPSTPAPVAPPRDTPDGTFKVTTYLDSIDDSNKIGDIAITVDPGGSHVACKTDPNNRENKTEFTHNSNHGILKMTCPAPNDSNDPDGRQYVFRNATRPGYHISPNTPHPIGSTLQIKENHTTEWSVIMTKDADPATAPATNTPDATTPAPATTPSTSNPSKPSTSTPSKPSTPSTSLPSSPGSSASSGSHPASEKKGSVQVTTYVFDPDTGKRDRLANVEIHIQSVGYPAENSKDSCPDHNKRTSGAAGDGFGQVHFQDCWTGSDANNAKAYQLSYVELPKDYTFKSYHITGPGNEKFFSNNTSSNDLNERFRVMKDKETTLEIVLNKPAIKAGTGGSVHQVITQRGEHFVPSNDSEAAKKAADALNALNKKPEEVVAEGVRGPTGGTLVPTTPSNFTATEDASGSVSLTWGASKSKGPGSIVYNVTRIAKNAPADEEPADVFTDLEELTGIDLADDLDHPETYIYSISASYDDDDIPEVLTSGVATVEIATAVLTTNVNDDDPESTDPADPADPEAEDPADPADPADPEDEPSSTLGSQDGEAALVIPDAATNEDLACAVNDDSSVGDDMIDDIGNPESATYQPVCRDKNGDIEEDFTEDVEFSVEDEVEYEDEDVDLYGYDGTDWEELEIEEDAQTDDAQVDGSSSTSKHKGNLKYTSVKKVKSGNKTSYKVTTKHLFAIKLVRQKGDALNITAPTTTLLLIVVLGVATRDWLRRRYIEKYEQSIYVAASSDPLDNATFSEAPVPVGPTVPLPAPKQHHLLHREQHAPPTVTPTLPSNPEAMAGYITPEHQRSYVVQPNKPKDEDES